MQVTLRMYSIDINAYFIIDHADFGDNYPAENMFHRGTVKLTMLQSRLSYHTPLSMDSLGNFFHLKQS